MKGLILKEVHPGVHRWERPEEVMPPHAEIGEHAKILAAHAAAYDALAARQRYRGADLDEAGLAQAKEDHLHVVHHILQNVSPEEGARLGKLRVMPWEGENDTLYNPHHHALFIGTETLAGGHARHGRFGTMIAHELAHAVDHKDGHSRLGELMQRQQKRAAFDTSLMPARLRVALQDHHEWGPRLTELALEEPMRFAALVRSMKASHGIDLRALLKTHLGIQPTVGRRTQKELAPKAKKGATQ